MKKVFVAIIAIILVMGLVHIYTFGFRGTMMNYYGYNHGFNNFANNIYGCNFRGFINNNFGHFVNNGFGMMRRY